MVDDGQRRKESQDCGKRWSPKEKSNLQIKKVGNEIAAWSGGEGGARRRGEREQGGVGRWPTSKRRVRKESRTAGCVGDNRRAILQNYSYNNLFWMEGVHNMLI